MNVEMVLVRLMARQHNLYIHAYPNYQALFRVLTAVLSAGCLTPELRARLLDLQPQRKN